jgi:hypothetical protein
MKSARVSICVVFVLAFAVVFAPTAVTAAGFKVQPGESIQAAVDAASPGDTITVYPGDYTETHGGTAAVRVTKPLKLLAKSKLPDVKVRILPGPGQTDGILVEPENEGDPDIDGLMIKGFTVEGFSNNGIWLRHVNNFKIQGNESINNLENGIWPTLSANGLVKKNVSYGSQDSALWVEASENIRVLKNELHHSPTGLEITVSKNIEAKKNDIHDNTVGIGLYHPNAASLPPLGDDGDWNISGNDVYDNNEPNSAPPGSFSAVLPSGIGILVIGVDRVNVKKNNIENNGFLGVAVVDWCIGAGLAGPGSGVDCASNPPIVDSAPDDNQVVGNGVTANGGAPPSGFEPFAADLALLAGAGTNNCFSGNTPGATTFPSTGLPACN